MTACRPEHAAVPDLTPSAEPDRSAAQVEVGRRADPGAGADLQKRVLPRLRLDDHPWRKPDPVAQPDREASRSARWVRARQHERVADEDDTVTKLDLEPDAHPLHTRLRPTRPNPDLQPPRQAKQPGQQRGARYWGGNCPGAGAAGGACAGAADAGAGSGTASSAAMSGARSSWASM